MGRTGASWAGRRRRQGLIRLCAAGVCAAAALGPLCAPGSAFGGNRLSGYAPSGIQLIQHVVMITQENRSFDNYFGTYPGADGIPAGVCVPDPLHGGCVAPYHDSSLVDSGGPHHVYAFLNDYHNGRMDGFVGEAEQGLGCTSTNPSCSSCNATSSAGSCIDVMGYHDAREIPNYWTYAQNYVLQDQMFESVRGWSWPAHLWQVSGWSAQCTNQLDPLSCSTFFNQPANGSTGTATLPWTDITWLLHAANVSWGYYIFQGNEPDCESDAALTCAPVTQGPTTPGIWNPLPLFDDVHQDNQLGNIQSLNGFYTALSNTSGCGLPNVSWIVPNSVVSEHPPASIAAGQAFVTTTVNAIMQSPCWASTAIFVTWDDWGGFYDHVLPPGILSAQEPVAPMISAGYGFRVPGLVISPYAKTGYIDHQVLSPDAYLKFIEDDFLGGQRICAPANGGTNQGCTTNDGRPDSRPQVAESLVPGDLMNDFDFTQPPRPPLLLPTHPAPGPASCPPGGCAPPPPPPCGASCAPPPSLQLTVSLAPRQRPRRRFPYLSLVVGCNLACHVSIPVVLQVGRSGAKLKLRAASVTLAAGVSDPIRLRLPPAMLQRLRAVLAKHRRVTATITVTATTPATGAVRTYQARVRLSA